MKFETLVGLFDWRTQHRPDDLAYAFVRDDLSIPEELSCGLLGRQVRAVARQISVRTNPGDRVMLVYEPGLDVVRAFWACLYAGTVPVPVPSPDGPRLKHSLPRLRAIAEDARTALTLTTSRIRSAARDLSGLASALATDLVPEGSAAFHPPPVATTDLAYLQYTSGSTSAPRGVMITHANVLANCAGISDTHEPDSASCALSWLPYFHDYGLVHGIVWPFYAGMPAYLMSPVTFVRRPLRWLEAVSRFGITFTGGPNFAYRSCAQTLARTAGWQADLSSLRIASCGAEPINPVTVERFIGAFAPFGFSREAFAPAYGMAEATLLVTMKPRTASPTLLSVDGTALASGAVAQITPAHPDSRTVVGCGIPPPGTNVEIVDPALGTRLPSGRVGEIWIAGPSIGRGYWSQDEASRATFDQALPGAPAGAYLRTGDLGFMHDDELFVTGRLKDLLIIHGRNHYPQDIEWTAEHADAGLRAGFGAALAIDGEDGEQLVIVQEIDNRMPESDLDAAIRAIRKAVADEHDLPVHAVVLIRSGSIPKTSSGKIRRQSCKQEFLAGRLPVLRADCSEPQAVTEPTKAAADIRALATRGEMQTAIERLVIEGVARLTRRTARALSLDASPIECGIDSLSAFRLLQEIEDALEISLPPSAILVATSLRAVAQKVLELIDSGAAARTGALTDAPIERTTRSGPLPLTTTQQGFWFLDRLQGPSAVYNIAHAVRLSGVLDIPALERSLQTLIARHAAMRVAFKEQDGVAVQVVQPHVSVSLPLTPLTNAALPLDEPALRRALHESAQQPFDLARAPLLRVQLLRLAEHEHVLLLVVHHLVADGWSMGILASELTALYSAYRGGLPSPLAALPIEFSDYVLWEHERLRSTALAEHLDFWRERLAGLEQVKLHPDQAIREPVTTRGGIERLTLSREQLTALKSLAHHENASLFMVLLAAFQALLMRWSGQDDIAVGTPVAGRERTEVEGVIGNLINTLVLRTNLSGNPSFVQLLERVRRTALDAYAHRNFPFDRLVAELNPTREPNRHPLFDVLINYTERAGRTFRLPGLKCSEVQLEAPPAKFAVTLYLDVIEDGIDARLVYRSDLFSEARAASMLDQYLFLLEQIIAEPHTRVQNYSLVTPAARAVLPDPAAVLAAPPQQLVTARIMDWARNAPERTAISSSTSRWTYAELAARAATLAAKLQAKGIGRGDIVAIMSARGTALVGTMLAVMLSGGVFLTIDPALPVQRRRLMLQEARARLLCLLDSSNAARKDAAELDPHVEVLAVDFDSATSPEPIGSPANAQHLPVIQQDDPAYVFFTSGSTGTPKAILGCHKSLSHFLCWQQQTFDISPEDRVSQLTGLSFDPLLRDVFLPLTSGATLCIPDESQTLDALAWLQQERITVVHTTPTLLQTWLLAGGDIGELSGLRWLFLAGEPLTDTLVTNWRRRFPEHGQLVNLYGPTETTMARCWHVIPAQPAAGIQPVGKALPNSQALVMNASSQLCGAGEPGEIVLRTPFRSLGYLNLADENRKRFRPNPYGHDAADVVYFTGDLGRFRADGVLEISGRTDDQIKIRGVRVEPGEVTAVLARHEAVTSCIVIARMDDEEQYGLIAYIVAAPAQQPDVSELRSWLARLVPEAFIPSAYVFLDKLPLLANGKVDRKALPAPTTSRMMLSHAAPRSAIEQALGEIWREVLKLDSVGVHEDFFELGGHSLLAIQVLSKVRHLLRVDLSLRALFEAPTIALLALRVTERSMHDKGVEDRPIARIARTERIPLSAGQQRMWFWQEYAPNMALYNIATVLGLRGSLDEAALGKCLGALLMRHEVLRSRWHVSEERPWQRVESAGEWRMQRVSVETAGAAQRESELRRLERAEAAQSFDLTRDPGMRATLVTLGPNEHRLLWTFHHSVCDGWSIGVLLEELCTLYTAQVAGTAARLPELRVQFPDYAVWEQQWLAAGVRERELAYWKGQLAEAPAALDLPTDHSRPAVKSFRGASVPVEFSAAEFQVLRAFAGRNRCTLFMVLLAAWQTLMHRYSRQSTILTGSVVANRSRRELERVVGYFANTVALRTDFTAGLTVQQLIEQVKTATLAAYDHQHVPFEDVVEALGTRRDASRTPLVQTMVVLEPSVVANDRLGSIELQELPSPRGVARFDLSLVLRERGQRLTGQIEYDTELFEAATITRALGHLRTLLAAMCREGAQSVARLPWLLPAEREQLLVQWNSTARPYAAQKTVHQLFEEHAARDAGAIAVIFENERLTYGELNQRANQLAHHLRTLGIGPDVLVGLHLNRSPAMVVAMLATLKAGGAYVPLDIDYPPERLAFMLADAECPVVISEAALRTPFSAAGTRVLSIDTDATRLQSYPNTNPRPLSGPQNLAYVMYTSGSTGKPKGVEIQHRAVTALVSGMDHFRLGPEATIAQSSNSSFDPSTGEIWGALTTGARLVIIPRTVLYAPDQLTALIAEHRITGMMMVASHMHEYAKTKPDAFSALDTLMFGGESPGASALGQIIASSPPGHLVNSYGPTEATLMATCYEVPQQTHGGAASAASCPHAVPIGRPIANTQIYILDDQIEPVPIGVTGEIFIGGAGVARGYRNQLELTAERFVMNPFGESGSKLYRTGDLGCYRVDGNIEFMGRRDEQLKVLGFRVEPGEIEAVLNTCPGVHQSVVIAHEQPPGAVRLVAYFVCLHAKERPGSAELRQFLAKQLPMYMIPSAFVHLDALPLTPNGKLDRRALPEPQHDGDEARHVGPRSPTEETLWDIWREVLRLENASVHDNFFDLGGHSLLATQVISRVRHTLQVELPLRALFETPTIAGLAERITQQSAPEERVPDRPIEALPRDAPLPLSFSQQRMWFLQQLSPAGTAYNMPFALRAKGHLDARALGAAVNAIVARHEAFRTKFIVENGEPAQVIVAAAHEATREVDLRYLPQPDREHEARRIFREESMRPFDLSRGSPHRFLLARLGDMDHALLWLVHHAVADQWSGGILIRELGEFYRAFCRGETPEAEPLTVQYADFAAWQRRELGDTALASQIAYWREKLQGLPVLTLPTDRPRPPEQTFRGSRAIAPIAPTTLAALKRLSARRGGTPFMTLLACFKLLLARYCNQEDVAIGTPIANRTRIETEKLVGTLVNTLVMRTNLGGDPTFNELLARVRETALGAYAHQDLPFERLVEELVDTRDMSHAPLVQVLFNVPNTPARDMRLEGLELEIFEFDRGSAQFDLSVSVDTDRFQRVSLSYSTELFDASTAERMLAHYVAIIEQGVAEPDAPISSYKLLTSAERSLSVHEWNRTAAPYPAERTDQLVAAQARRTPHVIAVSTSSQRLTYAELDARANRLARCLRGRGISREAAVGICLERSPDMAVALLAVMKAGGTYVPLDPAFPKSRLEAMALDAGLALCITHSDVRDVLPEMPEKLLCLDVASRDIDTQSADPLESVGSLDDLAYVLYTSGSTGTPKGVEISHRALTNLLWSMRTVPGCTERDTLLCVTTLSFDIAGLELYLPLIVGGRVALASVREASDGQLLRERMEQWAPSIMQATPATWRMLIEAGWTGTQGLTVLCGGEALPQDLADKLLNRCAVLWNVYGPTETTIWSLIERIERDAAEISIGRPIANTSVYVLDKSGEPVPVGMPGELFIGGHGVARGYRNLPTLTAERFTPNPFSNALGKRIYRTGDLARYLPDGRVVHLGRLDSQVKIRGFRIELAEIETLLARHPDVAQVVVAAKDDQGGMKQLVAYVIAKGEETPAAANLRTFLRSSLPEYMVPSQFMFMDAFPLTANRKVDVKALPAPTAERSAAAAAHVEPRGRLEVQLTVLWRQVLGIAAVGVHDNFFDMGGHSLKAVQLMSSIEQVTGRQLPLATLFQAPTVAEMARLLVKAGWQPSWRSLVAIQPAGRKAPVFAVPGVGGNVLMFAHLSKLLGNDRPFYGLQARGLDDASEPFNSIPKMAEHHAGEIRSVRAHGPYVIVGSCTGGVIAYEIAQRLVRSGEAVVLLVLETWHPSSARSPRAARVLWPLNFLWSIVTSYASAFAGMSLRSWPAFLTNKVRMIHRLLTSQVAETWVSSSYYSSRVVGATWHAVSRYTPQPYPGKLLNVIAKAREIGPRTIDTRRMWEELVQGGSQAIFMSATDSGRMFVSPHVEELAVLIERYLATELAGATEETGELERRGDELRPIARSAARR